MSVYDTYKVLHYASASTYLYICLDNILVSFLNTLYTRTMQLEFGTDRFPNGYTVADLGQTVAIVILYPINNFTENKN